MIIGGNYLTQQILQDKSAGFQWTMLPLLKGDTQDQMADPQTYSIARQSRHPQQAMQFLDYFLSAEHLSQLAQGDWLAPSSAAAQQQLLTDTKGQDGWDAVADSVASRLDLEAAGLTMAAVAREIHAADLRRQAVAADTFARIADAG